MARITVEDCIDKFESRFELVLVASNRARKLHAGETPTVEKDNDKPTVVALREIADESLPIESLKEKLISEYQTVSPLDEEDPTLDYIDTETEKNDEITSHESLLGEQNDESISSNISSVDEDDSDPASENESFTGIVDDNSLEK